jgi:HPt (histidine-containing phosphotransfer) domain-containing protein
MTNGEEDIFLAYKQTIPSKLAAIKEAIALFEAKQEATTLDPLRRLIHKLAGSSGTYGYAEASALCKQMDVQMQQLLQAWDPIKAQALAVHEIQPFFAQLEKTLEATR